MGDNSDTESEAEGEPLLEGQTVTDSLSKNDGADSDDAEVVQPEPDSDDS